MNDQCPNCDHELPSLFQLIYNAEGAASPVVDAPPLIVLDWNTQNTNKALHCYLGLCPGNVYPPHPRTPATITVVNLTTSEALPTAPAGPEVHCPSCSRLRLSLHELIRRYYDDLGRARYAKTPEASVDVLRSIALRNASALRCHVGYCGRAPLPPPAEWPDLTVFVSPYTW